jgi:hypothetical protein
MRPVLLLGIFLGLGLIGHAAISASNNEAGSVQMNATSQNSSPTPTPADSDPDTTPENTSLADKTPQYLCDHLVDMKHMSWDPHDYSGDAVYDALKRKGFEAMPCLVEKITDTQAAANPTGAPFWAGLTYRVGDTAVLMLQDMNNMYWPQGMLAKKYEDMFEDEGVFSYYFYVDEVPGAREEIQAWWRNWLKSCTPKCTAVPSIEH